MPNTGDSLSVFSQHPRRDCRSRSPTTGGAERRELRYHIAERILFRGPTQPERAERAVARRCDEAAL